MWSARAGRTPHLSATSPAGYSPRPSSTRTAAAESGKTEVIASTRIWRYLHMEGAITTWHARLPATRRRL